MPVLSLPLLLSPSPSAYLPLSLEQVFSFNLATSDFLVKIFFWPATWQENMALWI